MNEPRKKVLCLTATSNIDVERLARGYARASLNAIDRFFMQVRRRLSLLERPIGSASNTGKTWYGYSAYNPEVAAKVLTIFRAVYNFHLKGDRRETPAQRLGLADRAWSLDDILQFMPD
jgi:hypothetical protein